MCEVCGFKMKVESYLLYLEYSLPKSKLLLTFILYPHTVLQNEARQTSAREANSRLHCENQRSFCVDLHTVNWRQVENTESLEHFDLFFFTKRCAEEAYTKPSNPPQERRHYTLPPNTQRNQNQPWITHLCTLIRLIIFYLLHLTHSGTYCPLITMIFSLNIYI